MPAYRFAIDTCPVPATVGAATVTRANPVESILLSKAAFDAVPLNSPEKVPHVSVFVEGV